MCEALEYLHSRNILHRDLKPMNIFMTKKYQIKLGDFGISKVLNTSTAHANTFIGTFGYMAPEVMNNSPYSLACDLWGLGVCMYQMCTLKLPFEVSNPIHLYDKMVKGVCEPISDYYSTELR
mmetsp:Transcript_2546/g.2167  ORF Transcript_2546/g.2167 Transcript_2546/m.2167 type:complete len:122 (-) Transcript_2546:72-437(-)